MVSTKILYMVQDERELPYLYNMQDSAVCIAGKEIRLMFPGGMKVFVEKPPAPIQQNFNSVTQAPQPNLAEIVKQQGEQILSLSQKIDEIIKKEEALNEHKANGARNAF